jgi:small subunit ribosomal protein S6
VNLYEFTFIAQQGLLQQEVEGMVQELAVLLKDIRVEAILNEVKSLRGKELAKQELSEKYSEAVQETLMTCSDILGNVVKTLWTELEEDLSNLKEVKAKINNELKSTFKGLELVSNIDLTTKSTFINNAMAVLRENISKCALKNLSALESDGDKLSGILEKLLKNIEPSCLIKYEHWGLLDFAYPINKMKSGHYCILCISSMPNIMDEFIRKVKLNENVIRYLSVQVDKVFDGQSHIMSKQVEEQSV